MRPIAVALALCFAVASAQAAPLPLQRGIGVHEWLNWSPLDASGAYAWPPYRSETEWLSGSRPLSDWPGGNQFARIRSLGFDFIRLSVDPGPLVASEGARRDEALKILADAVRRVSAGGLRVVFDLHGVSQVPATSMALINDGADSEGVARYRAMVKDVAGMLATVGTDKAALEPFNEPAYYPCEGSGGAQWQRIMTDTVRDIRSVSTELTIVATGACGGNVKGLVNVDPAFDDPNILYSFHMYEPHGFTHQRAESKNGFLSGLPWPSAGGSAAVAEAALEAHMDAAGLSRAEKRAALAEARPEIEEYFDGDWGRSQLDERVSAAVDWAGEHGIAPERLFMGEFGAIRLSPDGRSGAPDTDRLRYVEAVRQSAERFGISWSLWEYSNPYGMSLIQPKGPAVPDPGLLKALGL